MIDYTTPHAQESIFTTPPTTTIKVTYTTFSASPTNTIDNFIHIIATNTILTTIARRS